MKFLKKEHRAYLLFLVMACVLSPLCYGCSKEVKGNDTSNSAIKSKSADMPEEIPSSNNADSSSANIKSIEWYIKNGIDHIDQMEKTGKIEILIGYSTSEVQTDNIPECDDVIVQIDNETETGYSYRPTVDTGLYKNTWNRKSSSALEWGEPNLNESYQEAKSNFLEVSGSFLPNLSDEDIALFSLTAETDTHITVSAPIYIPELCYPIGIYFDSKKNGVTNPHSEFIIRKDDGVIEEIFMSFYAQNPDQGVGIKDETPMFQMGKYKYRYDDFTFEKLDFIQ